MLRGFPRILGELPPPPGIGEPLSSRRSRLIPSDRPVKLPPPEGGGGRRLLRATRLSFASVFKAPR